MSLMLHEALLSVKTFDPDSASSWNISTPPAIFEGGAFDPASGTLIAVGDHGRVYRSVDHGLTWTAYTVPVSTYLEDATFVNGIFYAFGAGNLFTSTDGITWVQNPKIFGQTIFELAYLNSGFILTTQTGIWTSPDGVTWTSAYSGLVNSRSTSFDGTYYYVAAGSGFIRYATVPSGPWTGVKVDPASGNLREVTKLSDGFYYTVGKNGVYRTATPTVAASWVHVLNTAGNSLEGIAYNGSTYMVAGNGGQVYSSTDGINWKKLSLFTAVNIEGVFWDGSHFVLTGNNYLAVSP